MAAILCVTKHKYPSRYAAPYSPGTPLLKCGFSSIMLLKNAPGKTRRILLLRKIRRALLILKDILLTLRYCTP
jgi:hypothetical protein